MPRRKDPNVLNFQVILTEEQVDYIKSKNMSMSKYFSHIVKNVVKYDYITRISYENRFYVFKSDPSSFVRKSFVITKEDNTKLVSIAKRIKANKSSVIREAIQRQIDFEELGIDITENNRLYTDFYDYEHTTIMLSPLQKEKIIEIANKREQHINHTICEVLVRYIKEDLKEEDFDWVRGSEEVKIGLPKDILSKIENIAKTNSISRSMVVRKILDSWRVTFENVK